MGKVIIRLAVSFMVLIFCTAVNSFEIMRTDEIKEQIEQKLSEENNGRKIAVENIKIRRGADQMPLSKDKANQILTGANFILENINKDEKNGDFGAIIKSEKTGEKLKIDGKYNEITEIPVLVSRMNRGEIIKESDIKLFCIAKNKIRKDTIKSDDQLLGKELTRTIYPDRPISVRDLSTPKLVDKGHMIPLVYRTQYMELKTTGSALDNGANGDIIRVRNTKSGAIIQAMINENGEGVVNYHDELAPEYQLSQVKE